MIRISLLLFIFLFTLPTSAIYDKDVEKNLKKQYKEVRYLAHSDCYLVISKQDKGLYGVVNSRGKEEIPPFYKKIAFEKGEDGEVIMFALQPNYKAKSQGNIVYSFQKGEILDLGKNEPQYIKGGYITSFMRPVYDLNGKVVLNCQQTSFQPLLRGLNVIGYRIGTRTKINNDLKDEVLICDPQLNILFILEGQNYLWNVEEVTLSSSETGWKCTRKIDNINNKIDYYTKDGKKYSGKDSELLVKESHITSKKEEPFIKNNKIIEKNISIISTPLSTQNNVNKSSLKSEIDINIPIGNISNPMTFALIIANEDYQEVSKVPNAINDGEIFKEYCQKTLGLPAENIHLVKNATLNNLKRELNLMNQIAETYSGDANFIIYYAGHGIPDESNNDSYLMPIDGYTGDLSTCLSLSDFYSKIGNFSSNRTLVFIDACFSGAVRGDGMLRTARGVALKAKPSNPSGNMIIFSAAQGDETAYPLEKENHGLFTYWLLKSIMDSKGEITLGELADKIITNVARQSLVINGKRQTPSVLYSPLMKDIWKNFNLIELK